MLGIVHENWWTVLQRVFLLVQHFCCIPIAESLFSHVPIVESLFTHVPIVESLFTHVLAADTVTAYFYDIIYYSNCQ